MRPSVSHHRPRHVNARIQDTRYCQTLYENSFFDKPPYTTGNRLAFLLKSGTYRAYY